MTTTTKTALERLRRNAAEWIGEGWSNLHFTAGGKARLAHTAGMIEGIAAAGLGDKAEYLAAELCDRLDYLNDYGGTDTFAVGDGTHTKDVPRYRVVIGDDCSTGGFTLCWFAVVSPEQYRAALEARPITDGQSWKLWRAELAEANRWNTDLEVTRHFWRNGNGPQYDGDRYDVEFFQYRYHFNGAMLARWTGQEQFSVDLGGSRAWSIHT